MEKGGKMMEKGDMTLKELVVKALGNVVGEENVLGGEDSISSATPTMLFRLERAYDDFEMKYKPLCIVKVHSREEAAEVLKYCNENDIHVIGRTGASSSEDQLRVIDDRTIYLDGSEMNQIISVDEKNMMATVQCGVPLRELEEKVNAMGLTTGHCPQSQPLASIGGLVATRSIGQFSTYYGGIEDMVCGLEAVLPDGTVFRIRPVPRRAAGPDLRHLVIGSEGAFVFITEVTVKLFRYYPEEMWKGGYIVKDFRMGIDVIREVIVKGYKPSVVRLYDKADTDANYGSVELSDDEAFMFFSVEGPKAITEVHGKAIHEIALAHGAEYIGTKAVDHWFETRNNLCNTIGKEEEYKKFRETKSVYATVEVCADWEQIAEVYDEVMRTLPERNPNLTMLGGHVSHSYMNGTNIYFVYSFKCKDPGNVTAENYEIMDAICDVMLKYDTATIVHHHGLGKLRAKRVKEELGSSYPLLKMLKQMLDPKGIMNPGCLIPKGE